MSIDEVIKVYRKNANTDDTQAVDGLDNSTENLVQDNQKAETINYVLDHKNSVRKRLTYLAKQLLERAEHHDDSKLVSPEIDWLIEMDKEPRYKYGTPEYFDKKKRWEKLFNHHYKHNRHHPEHFVNGIEDMTLTDLCEYLMDISSYNSHMRPDDVIALIESQADRFKLDEQLVQVLKNTLYEDFMYFGEEKPKAYEATI